MSDLKDKPTSYYSRALISILCLFLTGIAISSLLFSTPKGQITPGIVTIILLIVVLVLSENFDNFSVGKLISINRKVEQKDQEIQKIQKEKDILFNQLLNFTSIQHQTQQHTNVYGDYHAAAASVQSASEEEIKAKASDEVAKEREIENKNTEAALKPSGNSLSFRIDHGKVEDIALERYLTNKNINPSNVIREAKLTTKFHGIDPINSSQPIFDGYYKSDNSEVFIEIKVNRTYLIGLRDRVYMMLTKLNYYQKTKGVNVHLDLVLVNFPDATIGKRYLDRFLQDFEPAIASGMLRISEIEFSEHDYNNCSRV